MLTTLLSHDDGVFESCQLCGHEQGMLDELVQPAVTVLSQSTAVCMDINFHRDSVSTLRPCLQN